ncbi:MAG: hypothetical protein CMD29_02845 [Flavobacteriales bacterium]|nr:hypothetical protein [Flavobacteriales bacterium]
MENKFINLFNIKERFKYFSFFIFLIPLFMCAQSETQRFDLIKTFEGVEIRYYPPSTMIKYVSDNNSGFGYLFNYISGKNSLNQKISMTTPVHMQKLSDNKSSMEFVLPSKIKIDSAPQPENKDLELYLSEGQYYGVIKYSGYTSFEKEKKFTEELKQKLISNNIKVTGGSKILVYNSPYKFFNRKNEIILPIIY